MQDAFIHAVPKNESCDLSPLNTHEDALLLHP